MKKETSRKIGICACIMVIVLGIISLLLYIGGFFNQITDAFASEEQTTLAEAAPEAPLNVSGPVGGFNAVWLDYGSDVKSLTDAVAAFKQISDWGFNGVVLSGGNDDELYQLVMNSKNLGLFTVYKSDFSQLISGGVVNQDRVALLARYGIDSLLIEADENNSKREISAVVKALRVADEQLYIGAVVSSAGDFAFEANLFDYKYIDLITPTSAVDGEYNDFLSGFMDGKTPENIYAMHTELVGNAKGFDKPDEIMSQFEAVTKIGNNGYCFYRYSNLKKNSNGLTDAITEFMKNGIMKDFFKKLTLTKPTKTVYETNQSIVSFVGSGDIAYPLTINGKKITMVDDGYFAAETQLSPGLNKIELEHKGEKITYNITYKIKLIESVKPTGKLSSPGGSDIEIVVKAHKSAKLKATLNGKAVTLTRSDNYGETAVSETSDYTYFVGYYTLPASGAKDKSLGAVKVTASYNGITESMSGATVIVNAAQQEYKPPVTELEPTSPSTKLTTVSTTADSSESSATQEGGSESSTSQLATTVPTTSSKTELYKQLTPYEYNGVSGKSKMIIMSAAYGETLPSNTTNNFSVPLCTPMLAGTIDYVVGTTSCDGMSYYVLASGRRVYQNDVKYLSSGYNMPLNEIRTVGVTTTSTATEIKLTMKWKVPFTVEEKPQTYYTQTVGRPYSVSSFTAEYIDIVFNYTGLTDAAPQFKSSVIKKASWLLNDKADTATLRLFLNKKGGFYGIKSAYNSDGTLTLSIKESKSTALSGKVIMLDAGHGGSDPGAIGTAVVNSSYIQEKTINLAIANKIKSLLEKEGATVIMTRTSAGQYVSLESRTNLCRSKNPDIFVAVHCDSSESSSPSGTTAYYYKSYSYPLAKAINSSLASAYKTKIYATNSSMAGKAERGAKFYPFKVTRVEECPSVLIEYGYVSNVVECAALAKDSNQSILAQATVDGLRSYFKNR